MGGPFFRLDIIYIAVCLFTADILACHKRKNRAVNINDGSILYKCHPVSHNSVKEIQHEQNQDHETEAAEYLFPPVLFQLWQNVKVKNVFSATSHQDSKCFTSVCMCVWRERENNGNVFHAEIRSEWRGNNIVRLTVFYILCLNPCITHTIHHI